MLSPCFQTLQRIYLSSVVLPRERTPTNFTSTEKRSVRGFHPSLSDRCRVFLPRAYKQVEALQWIAGFPPAELEREGSMRLQVKTRHGPQMKGCVVRLREETKPAYAGEGDVSVAADGEADAVGGGSSSGGGGASEGGKAMGVRGNVQLDSKDSALAPGQFAAFYLGDECLGAGVIGDSSALPGRAEEAVTPPALVGFPEQVPSRPALQESAVRA